MTSTFKKMFGCSRYLKKTELSVSVSVSLSAGTARMPVLHAGLVTDRHGRPIVDFTDTEHPPLTNFWRQISQNDCRSKNSKRNQNSVAIWVIFTNQSPKTVKNPGYRDFGLGEFS